MTFSSWFGVFWMGFPASIIWLNDIKKLNLKKINLIKFNI